MKIRQMLAVAAIPFVIASFGFAPGQAKAEKPSHQHEQLAQQPDRPEIQHDQQKPHQKPEARHQKPRPQQKKRSHQRPQPHQNRQNTQTPQANNFGLEQIHVEPNNHNTGNFNQPR
ncbi:hypothetical protein H6G64_14050 [Calothrix sp. FACHB-156]|nr:hypothetical protein [Calothrix sp. FACHB-156]